MTNELEKQFFDTFGIEKREHKECTCDYLNCPYPEKEECEECSYYRTYKFDYPVISDRILLELICLWNSACTYTEDCIIPVNYQTVNQYTLNHFIDIENYRFEVEKRMIKHQVRTLFEGE